MSTNLHVMGNRIRTARQFRRLTGEQLAEKLGIAVDSLRHIENGVRRPSYSLSKICPAFILYGVSAFI